VHPSKKVQKGGKSLEAIHRIIQRTHNKSANTINTLATSSKARFLPEHQGRIGSGAAIGLTIREFCNGHGLVGNRMADRKGSIAKQGSGGIRQSADRGTL